MSITAANVITQTREFLADDNESQAYKDATLLAAVNRAQRALRRRRPDLLLASDGSMTTYTDAATAAASLIWDDDWLEALAHYACYHILKFESHSRANREEALSNLALFEQSIR